MTRKKILIAIIIIVVLLAGYFLYKKYYHPKEDTRGVYEALVQVVDEKSGNAEEDKRSSLKKGDVIAIFPEGHPWTDTEKTSYLIVKMKLETDDVDKLTQSVTKEVKGPNGETPLMETVQIRKYRLNIDIPTVNEIMAKGQPYKDKIFKKGIIEEK